MSRAVPLWSGKTDDAKVTERERLQAVYGKRFAAKYEIDPQTNCWNWTGAHTQKGYGHMYVDGRYEKAHRLSYRMHCGPIYEGFHVCHICDNPRCVNPSHLWLGSAADNIADKVAKGRQRNGISPGERNGSAKLSAADVEIIRSTPKTHGSGRALAKRFGVNEARICNIRAGRSWVPK